MTFLPIVGRELRVASRQRTTYWIRLGAALGGIAIGAWILIVPYFRTGQMLGPALFTSLSVLTFAYALLVGVLKTADCLSEEKREGTLGLLFLTDLKGYDIVLGKLAATSLNSVYGLLAIFPVMAIPLLAGGVAGKEFWRVVVCALVTLFFSLSVGIFSSAISRDDRKAIVLALLTVLFFAGGLPLIGGLLMSGQGPHQPNPLVFVPSPGYACFIAFDVIAKAFPKFNLFWESIATIHALSWLLLITSCVIVPRTWQDKGANSAGQTRWFQLRRAGLGTFEGVREFRTRLLEINPLYWLSSRDRLKPLPLWGFLAVVAGLWIWGLAKQPQDWKDTGMYFATGLLLNTALKFWISLEASRYLGTDRKSGSLELLLSTPIPVRKIVGGHLLALRRLFIGPVLMVAAANFIFLLSARDESDWVATCVAGIVVFVLDAIVLALLGLWLGLVSRGTGRAAAASIVRVMVLPWMIFAVVLTFIGLKSRFVGPGPSTKMIIAFWLVISLGVGTFFGIWAWRRLTVDLRVAATRQYLRRAKRGAADDAKPSSMQTPGGKE